MSVHYTKTKSAKSPRSVVLAVAGQVWRYLPQRRWLRRLLLAFLITLGLTLSGMYGIARWYIHNQASKPLELGVSFIPDYASSLGVDPQETMDGLIGIGVKQFRLVSYWNGIERTQGTYDFTQLDWQFKKAEAANAKVVLTVGLRQPRWPECHMPDWAQGEPRSVWQPQLESFMSAVVERYKDSPSLSKYQLENEYLLHGFGVCTDFSRDRLVSEYNLVKKLDPKHPIIVGRSNNAQGIPLGAPKPDMFSISVYKRVWDAAITHRYLEYPFPAWYYGFLAGTQQILLDRNMVIGELQAEAWTPNGKTITQTSLDEQNKSLSPQRLQDRFEYGKATGMRHIDMWGAEYWYYRLKVMHDPSLWDVAKGQFDAR